jgi:uncharacterized protein (DUF1800 family)
MDRPPFEADMIDTAALATSDSSGQPEARETTASTAASLSLLGALAVALSACGGGGGGTSGSSGGGGLFGGSTSTAPTPKITYPANDTEAARFLLQAQFGIAEGDIAAVQSQGYEPWLNNQFNSAISQTGTAWLDSRGLSTPTGHDIAFSQIWGDFMAWRMLMTGSDQLRKRLSLALSEMMVCSLNALDGFWPGYMIAGYWDMLNANVFGNFRTLLEEVTLNPGIGTFLNTRGNLKEDTATGREPDENYAREVMQLFTIGLYQLNADGTPKTGSDGKPIETYTQSDITNLARVFTGYDYDMSGITYYTPSWSGSPVPGPGYARRRMALNAANHSTQAATFLGVTIPAGTDGATALKTALDTLFNHANVGPFFARQMIQRLVTSNPSPAYVQRVAAVFNDNGSGVRGDLKAFWQALLTDSEARTLPTAPTAGKVREPILRLAQWSRTFPVSSATGDWTIYDLSSNGDLGLGQSPFRAPSVFNFFRPGYVPPQTAIADAGLVAPEFQLHNESATAGYVNFMLNVLYNGWWDVKPDYSIPLALVVDAQKLVDWLNLRLTANQLSANTVATIASALNTVNITASSPDGLKYNRLQAAMILIMTCPEYLVQK